MTGFLECIYTYTFCYNLKLQQLHYQLKLFHKFRFSNCICLQFQYLIKVVNLIKVLLLYIYVYYLLSYLPYKTHRLCVDVAETNRRMRSRWAHLKQNESSYTPSYAIYQNLKNKYQPIYSVGMIYYLVSHLNFLLEKNRYVLDNFQSYPHT